MTSELHNNKNSSRILCTEIIDSGVEKLSKVIPVSKEIEVGDVDTLSRKEIEGSSSFEYFPTSLVEPNKKGFSCHWLSAICCVNLSLKFNHWIYMLVNANTWKWMRNRKGANHVTNTFVFGSASEHGRSLYQLMAGYLMKLILS